VFILFQNVWGALYIVKHKTYNLRKTIYISIVVCNGVSIPPWLEEATSRVSVTPRAGYVPSFIHSSASGDTEISPGRYMPSMKFRA